MRSLFVGGLLTILIIGCSGPSREKPADWMGVWNARWETDPGGIEGFTTFTMPGVISFDEDKVHIQMYGSEGCIFTSDTLDNSLFWEISSDSLVLTNDENSRGIVYLIREAGPDRIKLQLLEDIFITLTR